MIPRAPRQGEPAVSKPAAPEPRAGSPRLRDNVFANYAGQAWVAIMSLVFIPAYVRVLGYDAFGFVGLMFSIQALSLILDAGTSTFVGRELARRSSSSASRRGARSLVRSFELLVWPMAATIFVVLFLLSGAIVDKWLNIATLDRDQAVGYVQIIAMSVALIWPTSFYTAALSGIEQQRPLNFLVALFATIRFAGVLPAMEFAGGGVATFLSWYALVGAAQSLTTAFLLWRKLPSLDGSRPTFSVAELVSSGRFALGVVALTAFGLLASQMDRLVISATRPIAELGIYSVAIALSAGLGRLVQPVFNATYPRLSRLVSEGDDTQVLELYRVSSQLVACVVASCAAVTCLYSLQLLSLWTGDPSIAAQLALPLSLLFLGASLNGILNIPYALQLAHGWTRLSVMAGAITCAVALPTYLFSTSHYGMTGAAATWLTINLANLLVVLPLMHRRLLRGSYLPWLLADVAPPFAAAFATAFAVKVAIPFPSGRLAGAGLLLGVGAASLVASFLSSRKLRGLLTEMAANRGAASVGGGTDA